MNNHTPVQTEVQTAFKPAANQNEPLRRPYVKPALVRQDKWNLVIGFVVSGGG
jgi:hypothetical protein